jgi:hypothetical protein
MTALVPDGHFPLRYIDRIRVRAAETVANGDELSLPEFESLPFVETYQVYFCEVEGGVCGGCGIRGGGGSCGGGGLVIWSSLSVGGSLISGKRPSWDSREQPNTLTSKTKITHMFLRIG